MYLDNLCEPMTLESSHYLSNSEQISYDVRNATTITNTLPLYVRCGRGRRVQKEQVTNKHAAKKTEKNVIFIVMEARQQRGKQYTHFSGR